MEIVVTISIAINIILFVVCKEICEENKEIKKQYTGLEDSYMQLKEDKDYYEKLSRNDTTLQRCSAQRNGFEIESKMRLDYIKQILYTIYLKNGVGEFELDPRAEQIKDSIEIVETNIEGQNKKLKIVFKETKLG